MTFFKIEIIICLIDNRERTMNAGTALRRLMKEYQGLYFKVYMDTIFFINMNNI